MTYNMLITILQTDIIWKDIASNLKKLDSLLGGVPGGTDVIVIPEMFSTGFCTEPEDIAESVDGQSLAWMKAKAVERGCAIAGSVPVRDGGRFYNRFYFVRPEGKYEFYDKRHLFTYGGEDKRFSPGDRRVVVNFRGVRILLQVCYDLRFPVWARNTGDYDMIFYVASWPSSRASAWDTLLHARAIENQCYVAGVNRVGNDPSCQYSGGSVIIDPYGKELGRCPDGKEGGVSAEIDMDILTAFRKKFPVLSDADKYEIL